MLCTLTYVLMHEWHLLVVQCILVSTYVLLLADFQYLHISSVEKKACYLQISPQKIQ